MEDEDDSVIQSFSQSAGRSVRPTAFSGKTKDFIIWRMRFQWRCERLHDLADVLPNVRHSLQAGKKGKHRFATKTAVV
jgi:hypothetical protein